MNGRVISDAFFIYHKMIQRPQVTRQFVQHNDNVELGLSLITQENIRRPHWRVGRLEHFMGVRVLRSQHSFGDT